MTEKAIENPGAPSSRRGRILGAIVVWIAALAAHESLIDRPWDKTLASINATSYMGRMVRSWKEEGFVKTRGAPLLYVARTEPVRYDAYMHHPPLYPWTVFLAERTLGSKESAFRRPSVFFHAAALALLFFFLSGRLRPLAAFGGVIVVGATPMSLTYGSMPNPESAVLFFWMATLVLWDRNTANPRRSYAPAIIAFFLGTLFDWQGYFVAGALLIADLLDRRSDRPRFHAWRLFVAAAFSAAISIGFFALWSGSLGAAFREITTTAGAAAQNAADPEQTPMRWWKNQFLFWRELFTWPVFLIAAGGAVASIFGSFLRRPRAVLCLSLGVPAVSNIIIFREHAFDHDFWWFYAQPAAAAAIACLLEFIGRRKNGILIAFIGAAAMTGWATFQTIDRVKKKTDASILTSAAALNERLGADDLLMIPGIPGPEIFYLEATVWDRVDSARLREIAELFRTGRLRYRTAVYMFRDADASFDPALPALLPTLGQTLRVADTTFLLLTGPK